MSDLSSASCNRNGGHCNNGGISPIILILLLCSCGGEGGGLFGGGSGCGSGCGDGGLDGILPILLILCLCGGGF